MLVLSCVRVAVAVLPCLVNGVATLANTDYTDVADKYIITLKPDADMHQHIRLVQDMHTKSLFRRENNQVFDGVSHQYNISSFRGYAGHFDRAVVEQLKTHDDVAHVEADRIFTASGFETQRNAPYSLNLISHRGVDKKSQAEGYVYDSSSGAGTWAYIVDSGVNVGHQEFQGRATNGYNAMRPEPMTDTFGHGTQMAAIVGGKTFGVAKRTNLVAVKVMKGHQVVASKVVDGYQWAARDIISNRRQAKAVINMSVGGGYVKALWDAINDSYNNGVTTVVAYANRGEQAAWPRSAIAVSATDKNRKWARVSDRGARTTIWAPGANVMSAYIGSNAATKAVSGSSPAAAHVSGLVAYLKGMRRLPDAKQTQNTLINLAVPNVVKDAGEAPNLFAYNGSGR
ncbi:alkaline serine protease Alp1 [Myriangium duriaei CBS 260.36]|uniref:Alkaline serine protease Alp1 n=1 Tax=Myriangium duriaei CBS 260.36 TaxID=1168546 RepID=A0A9P4J7W3_9PEZI|nr:alkaline serine protease Alp1 [Myriangium duriaei CBS 260.36]